MGSVGEGCFKSGRYSGGVVSSTDMEIPSKRVLKLVILFAAEGHSFEDSAKSHIEPFRKQFRLN